MSNAGLPKISIVTIVRNDSPGLEKTIRSVIAQTYENIEFIVIDGASDDGTVDVIKRYASKIDYWTSEKDGGIYDAMNKGTRRATGAWINYMNAGDTFVGSEVLTSIDFNALSAYVLLYGNRIRDGLVGYPNDPGVLTKGIIHANHQAMFFNKAVLGSMLYYDTRYKIYADYELVNRIYMAFPRLIRYINLDIADSEGGGISSVVSARKRKEKYRIVYGHYGPAGLFKAMIYRLLRRGGRSVKTK